MSQYFGWWSRGAALLVVSVTALWGQAGNPETEKPRQQRPLAPNFDLRDFSRERPSLLVLQGDLQPLTAPSQREPERIARDFLRLRGHVDGNLVLMRRETSDGATFLNFDQSVRGIPVFQGQVKVALNPQGQVASASMGDLPGEWDVDTVPQFSPEAAARAALSGLGLEPPNALQPIAPGRFRNPSGEQYNDISADLVIFRVTAESARLGYRLFLEAGPDNAFEIVLDAQDGRLLFRQGLYLQQAAGQARVWKESPLKGAREPVSFPTGWLPSGGTVTTGNNVDAYLDTDGDDAPDIAPFPNTQNGRAFGPGQVFDFPAGEGSTSQDPRLFKAAAVTNLYYFVNVAHDYYYGLGFTEAAGNFQLDNFGRGGLANDPVRAEAQDRFSSNNASFLSTPDGVRPRLQTGLYDPNGTTSTIDDMDFSYAGAVILHEYGHGVSNRLVGGPADVSCLFGPQSRAMGEGWSDYFAISFFNDPVMGGYPSRNTLRGIRRQSYEGHTLTYEDLGNAGYEVHRDGEIWAAALWDLRKLLGAAATDRLVLAALKITPCNPSMIDARDALLAADQAANAGANRARIWQVFARHGMGFSAGGVDRHAGLTVHDAAFDLPTDLQTGNRPPRITTRPPARPALGALYTYDIDAADPDGGTLRFELAAGPAGMTIDPVTGLLRWAADFIGGRVKVVITDGQGGRVVQGFFVVVETPVSPGAPVTISAPKDSAGFAVITVPAGLPALQVTLRGGSGDPDFILVDPDGRLAGVSDRFGTTDTVSASAPKAGRWLVQVAAYAAYNGVTLSANSRFPPCCPPPPNAPGWPA